ncbi:MAG: transcriptional repressor [Pseudoflavonifractor sp.]|nr:transcriptional repressor [Pseudoflavonifractor sp.]
MTDTARLTEYLRDHGIKPSAQRIAIMRYLASHRTHPTVDEIYNALIDEMPTLSRTTVYNTLWLLADNNAVTALDIDKTNVRFDYADYPHAHFLCRKCGRLLDIHLSESLLPAEGYTGLKIEQVNVNYLGLCDRCADK